MSGYTPLFGSITRGSLCGRWPDIGLWPIVLSLADKNGVVDCTPLYISGVTGLPVDEVVACMRRFCEPDPYSRSQESDGRRLELIDEHRDWGWRIVNHGKYREKARLMAKNAREVESGRNADRMNHRRSPPETAGDRRSPPVTDPSNADTNSNTEPPSLRSGGAGGSRKRSPRPSRRCPDGFAVTAAMRAWADQRFPDVDIDAQTERFRDHEFAKARSDWPAAWRNWIRKAAEMQPSPARNQAPRKTRYEQVMEAIGDD